MAWDPDDFHDLLPALEESVGPELDKSLDPRGPETLLLLVRELGLPPDSRAVDLGCRDGDGSFRLATHFGFRVLGVDARQDHLDRARQARREVPEEIASRVSFERGAATAIPVRDASVDLVWARDTMLGERDLQAAYDEVARVLRPGGWLVAHQVVATPRLPATEAAWMFDVLGVEPGSVEEAAVDAAIAASGLEVADTIALSSEWAEWAEERSGLASRSLLRLSRLSREPDRFRALLGEAGYDAVVAGCLWRLHRMTGALAGRVDVLRAPLR